MLVHVGCQLIFFLSVFGNFFSFCLYSQLYFSQFVDRRLTHQAGPDMILWLGGVAEQRRTIWNTGSS